MEGELFTKNHKQPNILSARFGNERTVRKYVRNIFWKQALNYVRTYVRTGGDRSGVAWRTGVLTRRVGRAIAVLPKECTRDLLIPQRVLETQLFN